MQKHHLTCYVGQTGEALLGAGGGLLPHLLEVWVVIGEAVALLEHPPSSALQEAGRLTITRAVQNV